MSPESSKGVGRALSAKSNGGESQGSPCLPQVIEEGIKPGDRHHAPGDLLLQALEAVPSRYHQDLDAVRLLPRSGEIGEPYGSYIPENKEIRLFSTPPGQWTFDWHEPHWSFGFRQWGANIKTQDEGLVVQWRSGLLPCFFVTVLCHQLAQHYLHLSSEEEHLPEPATNENLADFHSLKLLLMTNPTFDPIRVALRKVCKSIQETSL